MEELRTFEMVISRHPRALASSRLYRFAPFCAFNVYLGKKSSKTLGHSHDLHAPTAKSPAIHRVFALLHFVTPCYTKKISSLAHTAVAICGGPQ
jgi:hypothetical protein